MAEIDEDACAICEGEVLNPPPPGRLGAAVLEAVFVMRVILESPIPELDKWVEAISAGKITGLPLCARCRPLVEECQQAHGNLFGAKQRWNNSQAKVVARKKEGGALLPYYPPADIKYVTLPPEPISDVETVPAAISDAELPTDVKDAVVAVDSQGVGHLLDQDMEMEEPEPPTPSPTRDEPPMKKPSKKRRSSAAGSRRGSKRQCWRHECLFCAAKCRDYSKMEAHMQTHTGEKPFWCRVCGLEVSKKNTLERHLNIHTGMVLHACPGCGVEFGERASLTRHRKICQE